MRYQIYEGESEKKQIRKKCLKDAARLKRLLKKGVVEFTYKKKDGSVRKAKGTLKDSLIPETDVDDDRKKNLNKDVLSYWDLLKDGWRCCIKTNIIDIKDDKEK